MLKIDPRGQLEAAEHIIRCHSAAEVDRIAKHCTPEVAEAIRGHIARRGYRARPLPESERPRARFY